MGGADEVLRKARDAFDDGDFRWAAELLNYVIFADPDNAEAKALQADTLEQLGYGAENGTWRNFYLMRRASSCATARSAHPRRPAHPTSSAALTVDQLFDSLALSVDGPSAWDDTPDHRLEHPRPRHPPRHPDNGVLIHHPVARRTPAGDDLHLDP